MNQFELWQEGKNKIELKKGSMYKNEDGFIFITDIKDNLVTLIVMAEDGYNSPETLEYSELEEAIEEYGYTLIN